MANSDPRRAALVAMRRRATGLLVVVAVVFVLTVALGDGRGWVGYLEASSGAAMVGGLADWFAVTALFRHPLGLRIPHTAVIVARKDAFGATLGEFVRDNFAAPDVIASRVAEARPTAAAGRWLSGPANAEALAGRVAGLATELSGALSDEDAHALLEEGFERAVAAVPLASWAGRAVRRAARERDPDDIAGWALGGVARALADNRAFLRARFSERVPMWLPGRLDERIFDRLFNGAMRMFSEVAADPDHELRGRVRAMLERLADDLEHSPEMAARAERLKRDILDSPELRRWSSRTWADMKAALRSAADDPDSELRLRLAKALEQAGRRLSDDEGLAAKIDGYVVRSARRVADRLGVEAADIVATVVAHWDAAEVSGKLELLLGRDLQFIRINGTVVGGLAGLALHAVTGVLR